MIRALVAKDDPILRRPARVVDPTSEPSLRELVRDMRETMLTHGGVGLAAPQIGRRVRVIVTEEWALANPEVVSHGTKFTSGVEGCLSLPGVQVSVLRPRRVTIKGFDLDEGREVTMTVKDMTARILLHEIDHVNGVLITDRVRKEPYGDH